MTKYNYGRLLWKMREKGMSQEELAKKIGISACSLSLKLRNKGDFRQNEIVSICNELGLKYSCIDDYFFAREL